MVCFNTRKHTNEAILYTVDGIEDAIIRRKKIEFNYFHLNEKSERVYVTASDGSKNAITWSRSRLSSMKTTTI